jgi:hypothetical protein
MRLALTGKTGDFPQSVRRHLLSLPLTRTTYQLSVAAGNDMASEFISEDDLDTFEGFLRYQTVDPATCSSG